MAPSQSKLGLSRKVVSYYLLFSLVAVCWLTAALILTSHALVADRQAKQVLTPLGRASSAVEVHCRRHGAAGLNALLAKLANAAQSTYWAVVDLDGRYLAHTDPARVGEPAAEPPGERSRWGDATCVSFVNSAGIASHEYRVALGSNDRPLGDLRVAIQEPSFTATALAAAHFVPLAVLAPMGIIGVGVVVLARLSRPVSAIETQLHGIAREALDADISVASLPTRDAMSLGWNRVVDELERWRRAAAAGQVTDRLAAADHERREAQFELILQRLSDGIAVTDGEGRIAFANRAIAALLGEEDDLDGLAGLQLDRRLLEIAECAPDCELLSASSQQRSTVGELTQKGSETERTLRVARLPLGADGSGHVWSLRDVTQQKLAEQTRDHFIDTATHELRTPLANIKAYAETLASAECIDVELQKEFCNIINSEVTRLARFIDDLLSISSMEAGALTIARQKVETHRLFAEVLSKVEPLMQQKDIEFQVELPPKMPELHLDKDKIVAVIVNVLGNAAKYTPPGGRVSLKVKVEEGRLRASVEDTGFGIAPEELNKVFEKFFRSDDSRVQAEVGTGLGLSLAREVVRMHGGEINVESELNKGSTFHISLPLA